MNQLLKEVQAAAQTGQPVLIHVKTQAESDLIKRFLEANQPGVQLQECHAKDAMTGIEQERIVAAGKNGMVTISSIFVRGTDIDVSHSKGLLSIFTNADDLRDCEQGFRRAASYGRPGEAVLIVDKSKLLNTGADTDEEFLEQHRHIVFRQRALDRTLRERENAIRNVLFDYFIRCREAITEEQIDNLQNGKTGLDALWFDCLKRFSDSFHKLSNTDITENGTEEELAAWVERVCDNHMRDAATYWESVWHGFADNAKQHQCKVILNDTKIEVIQDMLGWQPTSFDLTLETIQEQIKEGDSLLGPVQSLRSYTWPLWRYSEEWYQSLCSTLTGHVNDDKLEAATRASLSSLLNNGEGFELASLFDYLPKVGKSTPQWEQAPYVIARATERVRKESFILYHDHLNGCIESYMRAEGKAHQAELSHALSQIDDGLKKQAFVGADLQPINLQSWDATIACIESLITQYNKSWFKSFDRIALVKALQTALEQLKKTANDTEDKSHLPLAELMGLLTQEKEGAANDDVARDRNFFWIKRRNIYSTRFQNVLDIAATMTHAHLDVQSGFSDLSLHSEFAAIKERVTILKERSQWWKQNELSELLQQLPESLPDASADSKAWSYFYQLLHQIQPK
ncbi:MAG: hypothetical protein ACRCXC_06030 [Legionella sp.]